ncbi:hypothetical protein V6N13_049444 [Hibiscus sabdariffa]|uniref:Uncharacterized protein n=1 Tax=Hibiscus sabdariffa TaxID=183260 RepID=A0ABR2QX44_9ROSI
MNPESGQVFDDDYMAPKVGGARWIQGKPVTAPAVQGSSVTAPAVQGSSVTAPAVQGSSVTAVGFDGLPLSLTSTWEFMAPEIMAIFRAHGLTPPWEQSQR